MTRTFEQQRREFIELALKLIENNNNYNFELMSEINIYQIWRFMYIENPCEVIRVLEYRIMLGYLQENETELQKLRDLVGELG